MKNHNHALAPWLLVVLVAVAGCTRDEATADSELTTAQVAAQQPPAAPPVNSPREPAARPRTQLPERTFEDLLNRPDSGEPDPQAFGGAEFGHPQHDDAKLAAAGIRKIVGKQLTVYTDLPCGDVDDFPQVFDLALPQWQSYFHLPAEELGKWKMTVYVIKDKDLFVREGLIDEGLPPFQNGYQRGFEMWVYDQPSDYYRRHLFLHEGTHGVMNCLLGGAGPPWYMEGVAELLATHQWDSAKLTLRSNPRSRDDVPYWGRVKIVRDDFAKDAGMQLEHILEYDVRAHQSVNAYAWCWAACQFLDNHPRTQQAFREMQKHVRLPVEDFNRRFVEQIADWPRIAIEQWFLYVLSLDYGSQVAAAIVDYKDGAPLPTAGAQAKIDVQRGWQSSGVAVEAGKTYAISAAGKFTNAREADGTLWPCEPNGVTLRYHDGRPLGELLVAVRDGEPIEGRPPLLAVPTAVGSRKQFTPHVSGTLYFRVNDSPAELGDNAGQVTVRVSLLPAKP